MSEKVTYDLIGNEIKIGSVVAAPYYQTTLTLFEVIRIADKSIQLQRMGTRSNVKIRRMPTGCLVIGEEELTMYYLRKKKK